MNFDKFCFRPHYLGILMSNAKGKSYKQQYNEAIEDYNDTCTKLSQCTEKQVKTAEKLYDKSVKLAMQIEKLEPLINIPHLSQACKTKLAEIYTEETTGRKNHVKSRYMEKGLMMEEDAITLYSMLTGKFHQKNKFRANNGFIEGEMDFEDDEERALDTKVCWDIFTYFAKSACELDPIYEWQGRGYMWLYGKRYFRLIYCLLNTPEVLLNDEIKKLGYGWVGSDEDWKMAVQELRLNHTYDDLPIERKVTIFDIERDYEMEDRIKQRVIECREYLNNFGKQKIKNDEE